MSSQLEKFVKTYKKFAHLPALASVKLAQKGAVANSVWSYRNLERGKSSKFLLTHLVASASSLAYPVDVSSEILTSVAPSENFRAVLRELEGKQYLEVWQNSKLIRNVDLAALELHGNVYSDGEFASFIWSPDEKRILYVAEKKLPKSEPFYKRKAVKKDQGSGDEPQNKGEEYLYIQDWGEQLVGKKYSVLVQYNIENDSTEVLEGIPEDICPAQPIYSPEGDYIIAVGYKTTPRKLGLIYCTNRESAIFKLDFQGNYEEISANDHAVKSPRFSPDGKTLVWLQRKAGGPHGACLRLLRADVPLSKNSDVKVIIDIVNKEVLTANGKKFYGIYNSLIPRRCWTSDRRLVFTSNQKVAFKSYLVNIDTGNLVELEYELGSQLAYDILNDTIVVNRRNFFVPDGLAVATLPPEGQENSIAWTEITQSENIEEFQGLTYEYLDLVAENEADEFRDFSAIYLGPESGEAKTVPLVVFPHGGPHSASANNFALEYSMLLSKGYGVLLINYRGSIGAGQDSVTFLLGRIGSSDVSDCIQATDLALAKYPWLDPNRAVLVGGSHGGFLVTHLSGQYPDKFKAVVARNPVIDVAPMSIISDIPDWSFLEATGTEYTQIGEPSSEHLLKMREVSPIQHAHKVKAPTLLQIGSKDLRVPPSQGLEYYHRLKANGITARLNLYDDNHPLGSVPNEVDNLINTLLWIEKYISSDVN